MSPFWDFFINWLPGLFSAAILIFAAIKYFRPEKFSKITYGGLLIIAIAGRVFYAISETVIQQISWANNPLTRILSTLPLQGLLKDQMWLRVFSSPGGYFLFHVLFLFWFSLILAIFISWLFYQFLIFLQKRKERFFMEGETQLGFLAAFLAGWPGFVPFICLTFLAVLFVSIIRGLIFKKMYTTLGPPFLLASGLVILFWPYFSRVFSLWVLGA